MNDKKGECNKKVKWLEERIAKRVNDKKGQITERANDKKRRKKGELLKERKPKGLMAKTAKRENDKKCWFDKKGRITKRQMTKKGGSISGSITFSPTNGTHINYWTNSVCT